MKKIVYFLIVTIFFIASIWGIVLNQKSTQMVIFLSIVFTVIYLVCIGIGFLVMSDVEYQKNPIHLNQVNSRFLLITEILKDKIELFTYTDGSPLDPKEFKKNNEKINNYSPYYVFLDEIPEELRFEKTVIMIINGAIGVIKVTKVEV